MKKSEKREDPLCLDTDRGDLFHEEIFCEEISRKNFLYGKGRNKK